MSRLLACAVCLLVLLATAAASSASRPATFKESTAILAALPPEITAPPPACVTFTVRVSKSRLYASVHPVYARQASCGRMVSEGYFITHRRGLHQHWRVAFKGFTAPPCRLKAPKDLVPRCRKR
jgi:hypothetical protein